MKPFAMATLALFLLTGSIGAQESEIDIKKSDENGISVKQADGSSEIILEGSHHNTIEVSQNGTASKEKKTGFAAWIEDTDHLLAALVSLFTTIDLGWHARNYFRKRANTNKS